jgi:hypothetical protein
MLAGKGFVGWHTVGAPRVMEVRRESDRDTMRTFMLTYIEDDEIGCRCKSVLDLHIARELNLTCHRLLYMPVQFSCEALMGLRSGRLISYFGLFPNLGLQP